MMNKKGDGGFGGVLSLIGNFMANMNELFQSLISQKRPDCKGNENGEEEPAFIPNCSLGCEVTAKQPNCSSKTIPCCMKQSGE